MFDDMSLIVSQGFVPCLKLLVDFLLTDGLFLGALVILLPLVGRVINIFKNLF